MSTRHLAACLLVALSALAAPTSAQLVINEIDYDQVGTDTAEFLELKNVSGGAVNLDLYAVELVNGNGGGAATYITLDLPNVNLASGDYYVICANAATVINCDLDVTPNTDLIQNGSPDAIGLRLSGVLIDAVSYEGNTGSPYTEGTGTAAADSNTIAFLGVSRFPDGSDTNNNNADVTLRCITPGESNVSVSTGCTTPPQLPSLTINDVSQAETNAGTTTFTFTVSLSFAAGAGGVTFDIATADGTAEDGNPGTEDDDYVAKSLTSQTIAAGNDSYTFDVTVNGDTSPETSETFFVNVTGLSGAAAGDAQGQGTIQDDDSRNLTIDDVTLAEGDAGTTAFTFTVSLSQPAAAGGVTFDIATADGTAQDDNPPAEDNDYVAQSLTSQTIPATEMTYTFTVDVNGDSAAEADETFFVNVTNVTGTGVVVADGQGQGTVENDDIHRVHDVQGPGAASPLVGLTVTVEGVVVGDYQPVSSLSGFFLEEEDLDYDADPATSEGIFVFCNTCPTAVVEGQRVRVTGAVSEFFGMTEITASTAGSVVVTDAGNNLDEVTPAEIDLPIIGGIDDFYETLEGMRVTFVDELTVSEYFELFRFGHIELFEGGRPRQFTEQAAPSVAGYAAHLEDLDRRRVILDDLDNAPNAPLNLPNGQQFAFHPAANGGFSVGTQGTDFFRGGDLVNGLTGVLHWSFAGSGSADAWRVRPTAATPATFTVSNPRPATPPAVGGAIRAASLNLLNYFTTIDTTASGSSGPCAPSMTLDCRGADSAAELVRQRERTSIVICDLDADVYAFVELENTTASDTIADLLGAVNTRCGGANPWDFVDTGGTLGTDAIRVQLVYRTGVLSPDGAPLSDLDPVHNRPPTAQTFEVVDAANPAFGERFTVVASHFKSKGCPGAGGDADLLDGQSCFNATRVAQANRLLDWVDATVIPAATDSDVLLLGDFNAYAMEDPIAAILAGGYTDLESSLLGAAAYSYLFDGQLGHLDYALSSASLTPQVTGVGVWHINADEVPLFDYNDEVLDSPGEAAFEEKPDGSALAPPRVVFQPASPYRAADHDPVVVGLFQVADLSITKSDAPDPVVAGTNLTWTITVTNSGPDEAVNAAWSDTLPVGTTFVSLSPVAGWDCTTPSAGSGGVVSCTHDSFAAGSSVFTLVAQVGTSVAAGTVIANTATASSDAGDPDTNDLSATANTAVTASADLSISKTDGATTEVPGTQVTYTIVASNASGPSAVASATVTDNFPGSLSGCSTTCLAAGGATCTAGPFPGNIHDNVSLPVGGTVTYTSTCTIDASTTGALTNTAAVSSVVADPVPGNNGATDSDTLEPSADVSIVKTDGATSEVVGTPVTYTITVTNAGPSHAPFVTVQDDFVAELTGCSTTCVDSGGASCTAGPLAGDFTDFVDLPVGGTATYTSTCTISGAASGSLVNTATATVGGIVSDPSTGNNSSTDTDLLDVLFLDGFESGDTSEWSDEVPLTEFEVFAQVGVAPGSGEVIFGYDLASVRPGGALQPAAIVELATAGNEPVARIVARRLEAASPLELRLEVVNGGASGWVAVGVGVQAIRIDWTTANAASLGAIATALDGVLTLWVEGFDPAAAPTVLKLFRERTAN